MTNVTLADRSRLNDAFTALLNELKLCLTTLMTASRRAPLLPVIGDHQAMARALVDTDGRRLAVLLSEHLRAEAEAVMGALEGP